MVFRKLWLLTAALLWCMVLALPVSAREAAEDISSRIIVVESPGIEEPERLFDGMKTEGIALPAGSSITLENPDGFGSLYLIFDRECSAYTVTDHATGESALWGQNNFLHEFLDLEGVFGKTPQTVTLTFEDGPVYLNEIFGFTAGEVPDYVQRWEAPFENSADLVLFSTHSDDEQLFFAGLLPYYSGELGYRVQVVYLTDHRNLSEPPYLRNHEALDGLWSVGVRAYPHFGSFADQYSESKEDAYAQFAEIGVEQKDLLGYVVEQLRRFKPLVAVGHDVNGEYGHGQHMVYSEVLRQAVELTGDPEQFPESAQRYGTWDVYKTYLHLYEENPIIMDWDRPLERFDGLTAFLVTKTLGWPCHESQQWGFQWYMRDTDLASGVERYSPCYYGLYRSTVGADEAKDDFFENLTTYDTLRRIAEETGQLEWEAALSRAEEAVRVKIEEDALAAAEEAAAMEEDLVEDAAELDLSFGMDLPHLAVFGGGVLLVIMAVCVVFLRLRKK